MSKSKRQKNRTEQKAKPRKAVKARNGLTYEIYPVKKKRTGN